MNWREVDATVEFNVHLRNRWNAIVSPTAAFVEFRSIDGNTPQWSELARILNAETRLIL